MNKLLFKVSGLLLVGRGTAPGGKPAGLSKRLGVIAMFFQAFLQGVKVAPKEVCLREIGWRGDIFRLIGRFNFS